MPVKMGGYEIGRARVNDLGRIEIDVFERYRHATDEILEMADIGVLSGLTISPIVYPAVDGVLMSRLKNETSIIHMGGIKPEERPHHIHPFDD